MNHALRAAVVGVGLIGSLHARIYQANPHTELVGITDVDESKAARLAAELGVAAEPDVTTLLSRHAPDAVTIAVPEQHRHDPAVAAADAGAHLLLEKPLAPTLEEADRLITALGSHPRTVMVNFPLRSEPRYLQARELVASGRVGEPCTLFARRRGSTAGAEFYGPWTDLLISTAIHDLDAMTWVAGSPVERVYAEAVTKRSAQWGHEDAVLATLRFAGGAIGALETSWVLPTAMPEALQVSFHVVGTAGGAMIEGADHGLAVITEDGYERPDLAHWPIGRSGVEGALRASVDHFVECARSGARPIVGLDEARAAQEIVASIKESIRTETPVSLSTASGAHAREEVETRSVDDERT